jgi:CheY-like chemotaxis protein
MNNKRILLVAYENDVLESFPVTLTLAGHEVVLAHGGLQAIKQARAIIPDLIVLDAALPDMDGSTVQEILHRLPATNGIPTLLLKPRAHKLMPLPLQIAGIRAGLTHPVNPGELLRQVGDTLAQCRLLDSEPVASEPEMAEEIF